MRPGSNKGKGRPVAFYKRSVVFAFGASFVSVTAWSLTQSDLSFLTWWHYLIIGGMMLTGLILMVIAFIPKHRKVAASHDHLVDAIANSIIHRLLDKLF